MDELIERIALAAGKTVEEFNRDVERAKEQQPPNEIEALKEEVNKRVQAAEQISLDASANQAQLLELLIEMGLI